jgi:hypothetical protein
MHLHGPSGFPLVRRRARFCLGFIALVAALVIPRLLAAEEPQADGRRVKALFVVNFLSFAGWPSSKLGPAPGRLVIAVVGDPVFAALVGEAAAGRDVAGRKVVVKAVAAAEEALDAHLVFIASAQARNVPAILRTLADAELLTVGDTDGFAQEGVAINLYTFDNRVRIEVNSTAAARAGVRLSANLMRLARIVE